MGLTFEEFFTEQRWVTQGRTVTEGEVAQFCGLSGDFNPLHSNEEHCRATPFGTRIAHGPMTLSMAIGLMSQLNLINGTAMGLLNLNWDFRAPVKPGDTIHAVVTTRSVRPTRAGHGVVVLALEVKNQTGAVVQEGALTLLMKSGHSGTA